MIWGEFYTGPTGCALRAAGRDVQQLALYLLTTPHRNMLGLYHLGVEDIVEHVAFPIAGVPALLQALENVEFAYYDAATAYVWVRNMARFQLNLKPGERLAHGDKRIAAANRVYAGLWSNPYLGPFFELNQKVLGLKHRRDFGGPTEGASLRGITKGLPQGA